MSVDKECGESASPADHYATGTIWHVNQQHPRADDTSLGTQELPLRSIGEAAWRAEAGDTVKVLPGVYRERVAPRRGGTAERPIVYQAVVKADGPMDQVVVTAFDRWNPEWELVSHGVYFGAFTDEQFRTPHRFREDWPDAPECYNPFVLPLTSAPAGPREVVDPYGDVQVEASGAPQTCGQVLLSGRPLLQAANERELQAVPGSWRVSKDGNGLLVHFPMAQPAGEVELGVRMRCFAPYARGLGHIHVKGFTMLGGASDFPRGFYRAGNPTQCGVLGTRSGHHWLIEGNTLRLGNSLGLDIGLEGKSDADGLGQPQPPPGTGGRHIVRGNQISDNGCGGIAGFWAQGSTIINNVIERNNRLGFTAPEIGAIKLHFFIDGLIEGNLIRDNHACGVWLDNVYHRARITKNTVVGNQGSGVFVELGHGPLLIDHNVITLTRPLANQPGDGIYSHDASGVVCAHNLMFFNAHFGLWAHVATDRQPQRYVDGEPRGKHLAQASSWRITNNLFIGNTCGALALPPDSKRSNSNFCDRNLFAGGYPRATVETHAAALDPATFRINTNKGRDRGEAEDLSLSDWRASTGFDQNSVFLKVVRPQFVTDEMRLSMILDAVMHTEALPVEGLETDYFGRPLSEVPIVGPFQSIAIEPALADESGMIEGRGPYDRVSNEREFNVVLWPVGR